LRASLVGGLVNKFPVRQKCTAARFAPFVGPDTKSLTASRKRPLRGLHEKSGCRRSNCDPLISCHFVSGEARFVSVEAEAQMGRGKGTALRGGLPTGAWAGLAARRRSRPPTMTVFVFRAERRVADKFWFHPTRYSLGCGKRLSCQSGRYRTEAGKLMPRPAARADGLYASALAQAPCIRIHAVRLRLGAPDWETASGGLENSWKAHAQKNLKTFQLFNLSTFQLPFLKFPMPQSGLPNLPGDGHGPCDKGRRHIGLSPMWRRTWRGMRIAHSRQFPKIRRGSASCGMPSPPGVMRANG
jgi:hypothetical protein